MNRLLLAAAVIVPSAAVIFAFLCAKPASERPRRADKSLPARVDATEVDVDDLELEGREHLKQGPIAADNRGVPAKVQLHGSAADRAPAERESGSEGDAKANGKPALLGQSGAAASDSVAITAEHQELIDVLAKSGIGAVEVETRDGAFWGPAVYLTFDKDVRIYTQTRRSEQEAKEIAATDSGTLAWHNLYMKAFDEAGEAMLSRIAGTLNADR